MIRLTRSWVRGRTSSGCESTRLTVAFDTPASRAMSSMVFTFMPLTINDGLILCQRSYLFIDKGELVVYHTKCKRLH